MKKTHSYKLSDILSENEKGFLISCPQCESMIRIQFSKDRENVLVSHEVDLEANEEQSEKTKSNGFFNWLFADDEESE